MALNVRGLRCASTSIVMQIVRVLGLVALSVFVVPVGAQPKGGVRPPMGGPRGGMRSAKMRLPRLVEGAARLSGADALSKKQAKSMISLIAPWRKREAMSEDAGQKLFTSLAGTLTAAQKTALQNDRPRFGGGRSGDGRGPGGRGGERRGRGSGGPRGNRSGGQGQRPTQAQMDKMRAMMATFNPLYSGTSAALNSLPAPMKEGMQKRRDRLNAALSQLQQKAR